MNNQVNDQGDASRIPLVLTGLVAALLTYASLFPFNFAASAGRGLLDHLGPGEWQDRVGNIMGFMPLGLCVVWACERAHSVARLWIGLVLSILLALLLQVAQIYLPTRDPSIVDLLNNSVGLGLGVAAGGMITWRRLSGHHVDGPPAVWLLLLLFLLLYLMTPYLPTTDLAALKIRAKHLLAQRSFHLDDFSGALALWFGLLALWDGWRRSGTRIAALVVASTLLFAWRALTPGNMLNYSEALGALLGGLLALALPRVWLKRAALPVFAALILVGGLTPFEIRSTPMPPYLIPFEPLLSSRNWLIALGIAGYKSVAYGGFLLAGYQTWGRLRTAALWGMVLTGLVEAAQIVLASGTPELSDPLWLLAIAWIMHLLSPARPQIGAAIGSSPQAATVSVAQ